MLYMLKMKTKNNADDVRCSSEKIVEEILNLNKSDLVLLHNTLEPILRNRLEPILSKYFNRAAELGVTHVELYKILSKKIEEQEEQKEFPRNTFFLTKRILKRYKLLGFTPFKGIIQSLRYKYLRSFHAMLIFYIKLYYKIIYSHEDKDDMKTLREQHKLSIIGRLEFELYNHLGNYPLFIKGLLYVPICLIHAIFTIILISIWIVSTSLKHVVFPFSLLFKYLMPKQKYDKLRKERYELLKRQHYEDSYLLFENIYSLIMDKTTYIAGEDRRIKGEMNPWLVLFTLQGIMKESGKILKIAAILAQPIMMLFYFLYVVCLAIAFAMYIASRILTCSLLFVLNLPIYLVLFTKWIYYKLSDSIEKCLLVNLTDGKVVLVDDLYYLDSFLLSNKQYEEISTEEVFVKVYKEGKSCEVIYCDTSNREFKLFFKKSDGIYEEHKDVVHLLQNL